LTKTRDRCSNVNNHGTDGQTDRQSATQYAAPPREEGRIKMTNEKSAQRDGNTAHCL